MQSPTDLTYDPNLERQLEEQRKEEQRRNSLINAIVQSRELPINAIELRERLHAYSTTTLQAMHEIVVGDETAASIAQKFSITQAIIGDTLPYGNPNSPGVTPPNRATRRARRSSRARSDRG
jgi:hypothetical protein